MYKTLHFWLVAFLSGLFGGLLVFVLLFTFNLLIDKSFSLVYVMVYLFPLFIMWYATVLLRDRFGMGVISFWQALFFSALTGFICALVMSAAIYYVYTHLNAPALQHRANQLEAGLLQSAIEGNLQEKKNLVRNLMSPQQLAKYFGLLNLILLLPYALFIAIFARRKNRFLDESI
jgi:hypothetical protein